jgi:hypothetical protein
MSSHPYQVSEITIGREGNTISSYNDGSMVFTDRFNAIVRLSDLVSSSSISLQSITIHVQTTDWVIDHYDSENARSFWKVQIPITTTISDPSKVLVYLNKIITSIPINTVAVDIDSIKITSSTVTLISTEKLNMYVNIKAI